MTEEIKTKKCSICGEIKPLEEFAKKTGRKDNVSYCCILCNRKRHKKWYEANPEVSQAYRDATAEGRREYDKARYEEKYDEIRTAQAEYYDWSAKLIVDTAVRRREFVLRDDGFYSLIKKETK